MNPNRKILGVPLSVIATIAGLVLLLVVVLILSNWGSILNAGEDVLEFIFRPDQRVTGEVIECRDSPGCSFWHPVIFTGIFLLVVVTGFAYATLLERKLIAYFQQRVGPNRIGPGGFLQPAADGLKLIFKENITPEQADIWVYRLAPILKVVPTLVVMAVIPLGPPIIIPWFGGDFFRVPLSLMDIDVAVLWIFAVTSLATYGVALAGWSSSNKYSMLGAVRASAQMISYELSMGLAIAVPVMIAGSMSVVDIVEGQGGLFINWYVFQNPLAAVILMIALVAETNRAPFDLPEAEQELTAGYMTEYSGMKFALFMMAEYLGMIGVSFIAASMFFGGYQDGFGLVETLPILGPLVLIGKTILLLMGFIWLRATLPRIRYDRLMTFGWKIMLPLAILAVAWTAVAVVVGDEFGQTGYAIFTTVMIGIVVVIGGLMFGREEVATEDDDLETDPTITGERTGIAYAVLTLIGGLIAIPFVLYNFTLDALDSLAKLGEDPAPEDAGSDDGPALPSEASGD